MDHCLNCGTKVEGSASQCPSCGLLFTQPLEGKLDRAPLSTIRGS